MSWLFDTLKTKEFEMSADTIKSRPILFNDAMVRAILDGRKTQTRRVIKHQLPEGFNVIAGIIHLGVNEIKCPYGEVGDQFWVRETCIASETEDGLDGVKYLADDSFVPIGNYSEAADAWIELAHYRQDMGKKIGYFKTVPSIHMPRWASRITLEITGIRVERVKDINENDAIEEGVEPVGNLWKCYGERDDHAHGYNKRTSATASFMSLWDSINGIGSWDNNPWVLVIKFKRISQANVG